MKRLLLFLILAAVPGALYAQTVPDLMRRIDSIMEMKSDITSKVELTQQRANQGTRVLEMVYRRRDKDNAFMIVMVSPEVEKGNGYLKLDDNFWMYRRNTRTFQHINRDESISGTDASAEDFEQKKLMDLYRPAAGPDAVTKEMLGKIPVFKFEIRAKANNVKYPKKIYWVRQDNGLPLKEESYSLSGTLMATNYYLSYALVDTRYIIQRAMFVDEFEKGNKTILKLSDVAFTPIDKSVFTKAYLENLSK
ncbi:outer membrane lipoprotein-sorting protein [bacterium]|nr:outer membrane lipoprotein-sorting protein [bacterium]